MTMRNRSNMHLGNFVLHSEWQRRHTWRFRHRRQCRRRQLLLHWWREWLRLRLHLPLRLWEAVLLLLLLSKLLQLLLLSLKELLLLALLLLSQLLLLLLPLLLLLLLLLLLSNGHRLHARGLHLRRRWRPRGSHGGRGPQRPQPRPVLVLALPLRPLLPDGRLILLRRQDGAHIST